MLGLLALALAFLPGSALAGLGSDNLLENPDFRVDRNQDGRPDGWTLSSAEGSGRFELHRTDEGAALQISVLPGRSGVPAAISGSWEPADMIPVEPETPLVLSVRARTAPAATTPGIASVAIQYRSSANQWLASENSSEVELQPQGETLEVRSLVPRGAAYAQVLLKAHQGEVRFEHAQLASRDWLADVRPGGDKLFFINMDYLDMVAMPEALGVETYREKEIVAFFERAAEMGVDGVLWRVSAMGQVVYPSKVRTVYPGRADRSRLTAYQRDMADILDSIDPLALAIREARRHGIQIYIWVTLSDEHGVLKDNPNIGTSDFILDHPEYALLSRDGKPMKGTLSYSEPAVREHRLAQIRELIGYQADGIYLCTRTHAFYHNTDQGMDFGYNPPVVEAYQQRHGVNILKEPFDKQKWLEIRAEGLTHFIREAADLIHAADQKLWLGIKTTLDEKRGWPYGDALLPWKSWLREGWLDGIVSGQYYTPIGQIPAIAAAFDAIASDEQTLLFWQQCWHYQENRFTPVEELIRNVQMIATTPAHGTTYHEAHNLESKPVAAYWQPLAEAIATYWAEQK